MPMMTWARTRTTYRYRLRTRTFAPHHQTMTKTILSTTKRKENIPDDLFCFHNELSRVREKKISPQLQLDVTTDTSTGSVDTSTAVFEGNKKSERSPRHRVHSRISPASTYTPLTEYFPFGSPTKLQ